MLSFPFFCRACASRALRYSPMAGMLACAWISIEEDGHAFLIRTDMLIGSVFNRLR